MKKIRLIILAGALILSCSCTQGQQNNQGNNSQKKKVTGSPIAGTEDGMQPEYPDGLPAANKYLNDHFVYPDKAREMIQGDGNPPTGKVWVKFIVDADGSIRNVQTTPNVHPSITKEAERVLNQMPKKWQPATLKGKSVAFQTALRLKLDPEKSASTVTNEVPVSNDIKVSTEDRRAYEKEVASKSPYAKVAVAEYQQQVAKEKREGFVIDVSLVITRKQLGDRIVWREQFLKKYPLSPVSSKADNEIMSLMDVLIFSSTLDNSPTYEPQGQRIMVAEVREGFEELIKAYPESQYMQIVKKYYEMAKANGFKYSEERDRDFRKYLR